MLVNTVECDLCHTQKKENNHWYFGCVTALTVSISTLKAPIKVGTQMISYNDPKVTHLCGVECATKWLAQQLQGIQDTVSTYEAQEGTPQ